MAKVRMERAVGAPRGRKLWGRGGAAPLSPAERLLIGVRERTDLAELQREALYEVVGKQR